MLEVRKAITTTLPLSYQIADAFTHQALLHLKTYLDTPDEKFSVKRQDFTTGSCIYYFYRGQVHSFVVLLTIITERDTSMRVSLSDKSEDIEMLSPLVTRLSSVIKGLHYAAVNHVPIEPFVAEFIGFELPLNTTVERRSRRPNPGDPIDRWLDWREKERKRGQRITLANLADESGYSLSTLKKHNADRNQNEPNKEPK